MFRYIAIAWDNSHTVASSTVDHLSRTWQANDDWTTALLRPGLQVFTLGAVPGMNHAYVLQGGQGVILGKLFREHDLDAIPDRHQAITCKESTAILSTCGGALITGFWGRYIAFLETATGTHRVLRDPSGTLPCFVIRREAITLVFSWLDDALQMLGSLARRTVNWDALTEQLVRGAMIGRETALTDVTQLLPGERLDLHTGATTSMWSAVGFARAPLRMEFEEAAQLLRQRVRACTAAWASCYDTLMMRVSGGIDSSILLSCLAPALTSADVIGINYHSEGSDSDERHYARLTATRVGRDLLEQQRDPSFRIESVLHIGSTPDPVPYVGAMNAATDARLAAAYGAPAMFTGAGGDSLFFEFPRWWPAADYLRNEGINASFAEAAMDAARLGKQSIWRTLALALAQGRGPSRTEEAWMGHSPLLSAELRTGGTADHRFAHPVAQEALDLPVGKYMQALALLYPLGYYDPFEQERAPELVNPLLSQPLVELCLRLPTYLLTKGGRGRALARHAFAGDLPPQVINRRTKGGMEEHIRTVLLANIAFVREMLLDGQLAARGLVDRARLEELLSGRPTALKGPMGQIHSLVAAEAWLTRWDR